MTGLVLVVAVFLACLVEAVEAATLVLAAGTARDWRSALRGTAAGVVVLAVIVALAGPAVSTLPIGTLRLIVGALLLVFGLQWLRKAIARAGGVKALHDEAAVYRRAVGEAESAAASHRFGIPDWYAFALSFKAVLLEGLEVVFIVVTFGANGRQIGLAAAAAGAAILAVTGLATALRSPLSRVPENTLKFVVGVLLTAFGAFWAAEGAGADWPGGDLAVLLLIPGVAALCLACVVALRVRRRATAPAIPVGVNAAPATAPAPPDLSDELAPESVLEAQNTPASAGAGARFTAGLRRFGVFWYDYLVGDDWRVALAVVVALAATILLSPQWTGSWVVPVAAVLLLVPYGVARAVRR